MLHGGIFGHYHHAVEEGIDLRLDGSKLGQSSLEIAFGNSGRDFRLQTLSSGVQGFFFVLLQQAFVNRAQLGIGFFQQVLYAFVGSGERGSFGQLFERGNGLQFGHYVVQTARLFRQYGGNDVLRIIVLQQHGQTRLHEVGGFRRRFFVEQTLREAVEGRLNQFVYVQTVLHQHTQNTQCGAAQGVWVFVAGRNQTDAPNADQGFQFVGQSNGGCHFAVRQVVAGKTWLVVLLDGFGDFFGFAVQAGIVFAHGALQFWELADHFGHQVCFGQTCGALGCGGIRAQCFGNMCGNALQTLDALGLRTDFVVVNHAGQFRQAAFQSRFLVLFVEELSIRQARAQNAFVALDDV